MSLDDNKRLYRRWLLELRTAISPSPARFAEYWVISETEHLAAQLQAGQADAGAGEAGR